MTSAEFEALLAAAEGAHLECKEARARCFSNLQFLFTFHFAKS